MATSNACRSASNCNAASGFFSLFYRWSVSCSSHAVNKPIHARPRRSLRLDVSKSIYRHSSTISAKDAAHEPVLSSHLRTLMRKIPHSVVVCTSTQPSPDAGSPPQYRGMTLSSFTTLTMTPSPIVTFNIKKPSTTLDAIRASRSFHVHILSASHSGAKVADVFTKGNGPAVWRSGEFVVLKRKGDDGPPLLSAPGIVRVVRCEVLEGQQGLVEVGDHVLVLGNVKGILVPPSADEDAFGLGYVDGKYRSVGEVLDVHMKNDAQHAQEEVTPEETIDEPSSTRGL